MMNLQMPNKWPEMVVKQSFDQLQILVIKSLLPAWPWHYQQIATPTFSEGPIFHALQACLAKVIGCWFCQGLQTFLYKKYYF